MAATTTPKRRVTALDNIRSGKIGDDFPGWGTDDAIAYIRANRVQPGQQGTILHVESHGSNPWTRYTIQWDDGTRSSGISPNQIR